MPQRNPRRRHNHRPPGTTTTTSSTKIRISDRKTPRGFREIIAFDTRDGGRLASLIEDILDANPEDPLIISLTGHTPHLEPILATSLDLPTPDIADLARAVQYAGTMQFPQNSTRRAWQPPTIPTPWSFILDHLNVAQVYYWSAHLDPPTHDRYALPSIENARFRLGAFHAARGACRLDRTRPVTLLFTRPTPVTEHVVTHLLFPYLHADASLTRPADAAAGVCWVFTRLYALLTDWQNVLSEIVTRLDEAEVNSHGGKLLVKMRARMMHNEVDRIYEQREYLRFHRRALAKLARLAPPRETEDEDTVWGDLDDAVEDLAQFESTLDGLRERFINLIELEFNIQSAVQADSTAFLAVVATVFLPVSFLASLFGISTSTWQPILYLWCAIPIVVASLTAVALFPSAMRVLQRVMYPRESRRTRLMPRDFTMLGEELPQGADGVGGGQARQGGGGLRRKATRPVGMDDVARMEARSKSRARGEKGEDW